MATVFNLKLPGLQASKVAAIQLGLCQAGSGCTECVCCSLCITSW
jgi:hypothetical protein